MSGVPPFFSHAFSSKVYTLDIWLALVHVMHCMALVHHVHGLPTYLYGAWYLLASAATCMHATWWGYHMICSTLNNWESMCLPTWFNDLSW